LDSIKQTGLGSEWKSWGEWFITEARWIETIHTSYSSSPDATTKGQ
jgi:hypothetical protein